MFPMASLMVGAYIVTRMISLIATDDPNADKTGRILSKVLAVITIVVTIYCVYSILVSGLDIPEF